MPIRRRRKVDRGQKREEWKTLLLNFLLSFAAVSALVFSGEFKYADRHFDDAKKRVFDGWKVLKTPGLVSYSSGKEPKISWWASYEGEPAWVKYPVNRWNEIPKPVTKGWDVRANEAFPVSEGEEFSEIEFTISPSEAVTLLKAFVRGFSPSQFQKMEAADKTILGAKWTDGAIIHRETYYRQTMLINSSTGRVFVKDAVILN